MANYTELLQLADEAGVECISLCGSVARGEDHDATADRLESDFDFLVEGFTDPDHPGVWLRGEASASRNIEGLRRYRWSSSSRPSRSSELACRGRVRGEDARGRCQSANAVRPMPP